MDKNGSRFEGSNHFSGPCTQCGEVYEAHSRTDDLEGISFRCKKMGCTGRVTLEFDAAKLFHPKRGGSHSKPHRVC